MSKNYKSELIKDYLKKYPKHPNLTIAKLIYNENKEVFTSVDTVRAFIRGLKGQKGNYHRQNTKDKSLYTEPGSNNPFNLPESYADDFNPFVISQSNGLIISDLHVPYHHVDSITQAIRYGQQKKCNFVLINGDLLDFAMISRHEKDWRQRKPHEEFESARTILKAIRKEFPNARIVFKEGNHDERWEKWLFVKAPELFGDPEFTLEARLQLGELGIEIVKNKKPIKIGKLTVLHGHELAGGSGGVNPARATFLKTLDSVLVGHYHKRSSHDETTMGGNVISVQSMGCLCGMNPHYMPVNKWQHGFVHVEHDIITGEYMLHNHVIIKGKVY